MKKAFLDNAVHHWMPAMFCVYEPHHSVIRMISFSSFFLSFKLAQNSDSLYFACVSFVWLFCNTTKKAEMLFHSLVMLRSMNQQQQQQQGRIKKNRKNSYSISRKEIRCMQSEIKRNFVTKKNSAFSFWKAKIRQFLLNTGLKSRNEKWEGEWESDMVMISNPRPKWPKTWKETTKKWN